MKLGRSSVEIIFISIVIIAAYSCLARPDYNLPLFAFLWWVFFHIPEPRKQRHQRYLVLFVLLSCFQDVVYLIYWPSKWFSSAWNENTGHKTQLLHLYTCIASLIELVLKLILILILLAPRLVDETTSTLRDCCSKVDEYEEYEVVTYHQSPYQNVMPTNTITVYPSQSASAFDVLAPSG